jgi:hypothetical protein
MDRLAAQAAPPSALRRYAQQRATHGEGTGRRTGTWRRLLHGARPHHV